MSLSDNDNKNVKQKRKVIEEQRVLRKLYNGSGSRKQTLFFKNGSSYEPAPRVPKNSSIVLQLPSNPNIKNKGKWYMWYNVFCLGLSGRDICPKSSV